MTIVTIVIIVIITIFIIISMVSSFTFIHLLSGNVRQLDIVIGQGTEKFKFRLLPSC